MTKLGRFAFYLKEKLLEITFYSLALGWLISAGACFICFALFFWNLTMQSWHHLVTSWLSCLILTCIGWIYISIVQSLRKPKDNTYFVGTRVINSRLFCRAIEIPFVPLTCAEMSSDYTFDKNTANMRLVYREHSESYKDYRERVRSMFVESLADWCQIHYQEILDRHMSAVLEQLQRFSLGGTIIISQAPPARIEDVTLTEVIDIDEIIMFFDFGGITFRYKNMNEQDGGFTVPGELKRESDESPQAYLSRALEFTSPGVRADCLIY